MDRTRGQLRRDRWIVVADMDALEEADIEALHKAGEPAEDEHVVVPNAH